QRLPGIVVNGRVALELLGVGPLRAGAGKARIALGPNPILGGYPGKRRADDASEPVYARAIALEVEGLRALIASIDTVLVPGSLEEEVMRRARLPPLTCLLLAATHTHSGPGGAWDSVIAGWAGAGPFDRAQRDAIAQAAADALTQAIAALGPAEFLVAREEWPQGPARPRSAGPIDSQLVALRMRRPGGEDVATLIDYSMHPTTAPRSSRRISADWPGRVAAALEGPPVLVVQGAGGNATWERGVDVAASVAREAQASPSGPGLVPVSRSCLSYGRDDDARDRRGGGDRAARGAPGRRAGDQRRRAGAAAAGESGGGASLCRCRARRGRGAGRGRGDRGTHRGRGQRGAASA